MKVLVDTCIWSLALGHQRPEEKISAQLKTLISEGLVAIIGPIKQELLTGLKNKAQFSSLEKMLQPFESIPLGDPLFIQAAQLANQCRNKGIQGSHTDFLLCAVALAFDLKIFTVDRDFQRYAKLIKVKLYE